jgi:hypothetical protein
MLSRPPETTTSRACTRPTAIESTSLLPLKSYESFCRSSRAVGATTSFARSHKRTEPTVDFPSGPRCWPAEIMRRGPRRGPGQGPRIQPVQDHADRFLIRCPVPAGNRVPRGSQPGQVFLARPLRPLPDRGQPVVPGGGERADRDRDLAGQRVDPPLRGARVRQRLQPRHVLAARSRLSGPDSTTRAPARDNATAGTPHLVHADLRDLHDHVASPHLQAARSPPSIPYGTKPRNSGTRRSPGPAARTMVNRRM